MDNTFDKLFYDKGVLAGIDESGVSDIAGPLVAACVILPQINVRKDDLAIFDVNDSKTVPEKHRKKLAEVIHQFAIGIGIGVVNPDEIDYLKKHRAINLGMYRALANCRNADDEKVIPDFILVDGKERVKEIKIPQEAIVKADEKSLCVAAASIIAKVYRDSIMAELHTKYPYYMWNKNKGYPCEDQFQGLDKHGIVFGVHRVMTWPFLPAAKKETQAWANRRRKWKQATENLLHLDKKENFHG